MPERVFSEGLELPDGRKVRVLAYDDGSVRFRVSGTPYAMVECFLTGGSNDHAIIKLAPADAPPRRRVHIENVDPKGELLTALRNATTRPWVRD